MSWLTVAAMAFFALGGGMAGYSLGRQHEGEEWAIRWGSHRLMFGGRVYLVICEGAVRPGEVPPDV